MNSARLGVDANIVAPQFPQNSLETVVPERVLESAYVLRVLFLSEMSTSDFLKKRFVWKGVPAILRQLEQWHWIVVMGVPDIL